MRKVLEKKLTCEKHAVFVEFPQQIHCHPRQQCEDWIENGEGAVPTLLSILHIKHVAPCRVFSYLLNRRVMYSTRCQGCFQKGLIFH